MGIKECDGQLSLVCEQCGGQRIIRSDDTPAEVCDWCDGSGIDPEAITAESAHWIDRWARAIATEQSRRGGKKPG